MISGGPPVGRHSLPIPQLLVAFDGGLRVLAAFLRLEASQGFDDELV